MNPNTCITEHMLPEFASKAWIKSSTPTNILSGFAATGIWPINRLIFPDEAFAGAEVTERPPPQADGQELPDLNPDLEATPSTPPRQPTQEPSTNNPSTSTHSPPGPSSVGDISEVTPDSVRPFPKASARPLGKGRKKVRACILTENEEAIANLKAKEEKKAG
ncbi:hypothetical protein GWK47_031262 [Chionoecetes opilio]|uniref:Uncharacterized protein n=1 Tax=Chionoecetes opilio TaxID=41210 RepID=A0A8J4YV74_CHIOP|nr:hypothetical protein GWK47_031262 [Chionoecetes opilio]